MRFVFFALAAVLSIAAVVLAYVNTAAPGWAGAVCIVLAGLFLLLGFYEQYKRKEDEPIELTVEERETIQRMKSEGNFQLAVKQVQMWKRRASQDDAARIVREV